MNMKNVAQMVSIVGMLENTKHDVIPGALAVEVFGSDENCINAMGAIYAKYNNLTEDQIATLYSDMLKECFIAIKADLEANALKEKENVA